jgi:hypothetical protein
MKSFQILLGTALAGALLAPCAAFAAPQTYDYVITHSRYGKIGTYDRTIDESGGVTHAQSHLRIAVKMLGMVVHRENAEQSETWRGKRLVAFHSVTTSNGKPMTVSGEARANSFVVTSPAGTATAPADVAATDPWGFSRMGPAEVVSLKSGKIEPVNVTGGEADAVMMQGVRQPARHFHVSTSTQPNKWEVWLDPEGVPIKFRSLERGDAVDFTLTSRRPTAPGPRPVAMVSGPQGPDVQ